MKWGVTKPRVYVTRLLPKEAMDRIHSHCDAKVWGGELSPPRDVLLRNVADVEGLVCLLTDRIDSKLMDRAPNMKVVSNYAVGFDNIDVTEATNRGILIGNTPDALTETTADFAFALIMSAARRIAEADSYVRGGKWHTWGPMLLLGRDVHNSTLGIIGLGRIGAAVARRARGFNMHILYSSRVRQRQREQELGIEYAELDKVLAESDFITVHTTLSPGTHHLLSAKHFEKMKRTCILVNTARGPVVDNMALYDALRAGNILCAALDVTEPEPLPTNHPLLTLNNVIVTPHIASASTATRRRMALIAADNLIAGLSGQLGPATVNPQALNKHSQA